MTVCTVRRYEQLRDISRDDRTRIATCRLRMPTDRQTDLRRIIVYMMVSKKCKKICFQKPTSEKFMKYLCIIWQMLPNEQPVRYATIAWHHNSMHSLWFVVQVCHFCVRKAHNSVNHVTYSEDSSDPFVCSWVVDRMPYQN